MDTDLNIYPVKDEGDDKAPKRELHPNLPDVYKAQAMLLVAPLRGGKGVLIQNLLHRFYKDLFNSIDFISPTAATDSTNRHSYELYKNSTHLEYDDSIIQGIISRQEDLMKNKLDTSYALIMDDCLGMLPKNGRKGNLVTYFLTRFRHYVTRKNNDACLFVFSTQKFREVHTVIRAQATTVMISSKLRNQKEIEALIEEYGDMYGGAENFMKMFNYVKKEKWAWLYLALDTGCAYKNFTEMLHDGDNLLKANGEEGELEEDDEEI